MMKNEFPNQDLSICGIGGVETGSGAAEFILLGAKTIQVKFVKFTILANRRNGSSQSFRLAQLQDKLPSNEPGFFHRMRLHLLTLKQKGMYRSMQIPLKGFKQLQSTFPSVVGYCHIILSI